MTPRHCHSPCSTATATPSPPSTRGCPPRGLSTCASTAASRHGHLGEHRARGGQGWRFGPANGRGRPALGGGGSDVRGSHLLRDAVRWPRTEQHVALPGPVRREGRTAPPHTRRSSCGRCYPPLRRCSSTPGPGTTCCSSAASSRAGPREAERHGSTASLEPCPSPTPSSSSSNSKGGYPRRLTCAGSRKGAGSRSRTPRASAHGARTSPPSNAAGPSRGTGAPHDHRNALAGSASRPTPRSCRRSSPWRSSAPAGPGMSAWTPWSSTGTDCLPSPSPTRSPTASGPAASPTQRRRASTSTAASGPSANSPAPSAERDR